MSSTQWHFNKFKDHYDFDDSPIDMVRQNEEKSCDAFGIWSTIFGKQEVTATTTQEPLDIKSESNKNSVTDIEKRKSTKKDRKLKNVVDKQSSKNRKDDKNAKMLKDILTENTQRRLKEGVLVDKRLEQELVAVRRQLELDKKHQQAMKEQLCQKKEEYHRQETGDEPTVEPIVGEVKTARPGAAFDLFGLLNSWSVEPVSADGSSPPQSAPATLTKSFSGEVSIAAMNATLRRSSGSGEGGVVRQESDSSTVSDLSDASYNTTASFVATHFGASNTLHRASSVEGVTAHDITNFARFISAGGVNCDFYLPAREGDAKPMRATIKCDPESTLLQLEVSIRGPGDSSLKKVLSFDIVADVVSIVAGRGPLVAVAASASNDSLLHILLLNKPELNLGFCNMATRDVVLTALPMHLSKAKLSSKSSDSGSKPIFSISRQGRSKPLVGSVGGTLMGLSANILKLTMFQFVEMKVKTLLRNGYRTRLLLVRSDGVLQFFAPPKEYETLQQTQTSSEVLTSAQLTAVAEVESRRSSLLTELQIYLQSRWDSDFLTDKGFTSELEVSFSLLEKTMSVGETEADSAVHILSKTNNICYKLKVDQAERRRALVVFLETQRKKARKAAV